MPRRDGQVQHGLHALQGRGQRVPIQYVCPEALCVWRGQVRRQQPQAEIAAEERQYAARNRSRGSSVRFPGPKVEQRGMQSCTLDLPDLAATTALGRHLARLLFPGAVVGLVGPLGAGKTHLVRAVAEGLGVTNNRTVSSPTFVLIQEYQARLPIYHFDAYRLHAPAEFFDLGAHEYFEGTGVCLVEWADRVAECLPSEHLRITLAVTGESSRRAVVEGRGERYAAVVRELQRATPFPAA